MVLISPKNPTDILPSSNNSLNEITLTVSSINSSTMDLENVTEADESEPMKLKPLRPTKYTVYEKLDYYITRS